MEKKNTTMTFSLGSEKYGTSVMKEEECLLFVETAIENGSDVLEAIKDMRMVDNLMYMKRLHLITHGYNKLTQAGHARKGAGLFDGLMSIVDGRVKDAL